jgi:hypothetical protein
VRVIYSDEAGRGNLTSDPHFVVACAITHPDTQWHHLRQHYTELANDVFDLREVEESFDEYVFHAMDVWHGSGDFPRNRFSLRERMQIMTRLSQVPAHYKVPICLGMIDRVGLDRFHKENNQFANLSGPAKEKSIRSLTHAYCYARALQHVDSWMVANCPDEVAMVIAEDTNEVKEAVRSLHEGAKKRDTHDDYYDRDFFVTKLIVDTVNFATKEHSPLLRIADHCAFLAKRIVDGCSHAKPMWRNILPQLCTENRHVEAGILINLPLDAIRLVERSE